MQAGVPSEALQNAAVILSIGSEQDGDPPVDRHKKP
jgi:hypothetical protein